MKEREKRQLAAIMFTDIVGYTALMEENEATAALVRKRHRKVFQEQHEIFHGEIVQYFGDGSLSVFKSAIEAVQCAIDIQKKLKEADPVPLRIGLHMGDIVFDKTEVYGDGVNIASRIESMAVAGAILLSGKINDELKNHKEITTTLMELFELKNVAKPVEVFAVTNKGITVPALSDLKGKQRLLSKTIAVLPFINMSTSEDNEYFSDGITEEIINALAKVSSLKVTSRTF
jgi:adenylate cyclase